MKYYIWLFVIVPFIVAIGYSQIDTSQRGLYEISSRQPHEYEKTQGLTIDSLVAPYAEEYATLNDIDLQRVLNVLYKGRYPDTSYRAFTSYHGSGKYYSPNWTHYRSNKTIIYQIIRIESRPENRQYIAVMYGNNALLLTILDLDYQIVKSFDLHKLSKHKWLGYYSEGTMDDLETSGGKLIAKYVDEDSDREEPPWIGFRFEFVSDHGTVKFLKAKKIKDDSEY